MTQVRAGETITLDVVQRSPEWIKARLGRLTGSCADAMLSEGRGSKESAARRNLRVALALERITGEPQDESFYSKDMKRGEELEAFARRAYEATTGRLLSTVGFVSCVDLLAGCSPDALAVGVIDFKCPRPGNHLEYLRSTKMPTEYERQLTHNLWITGAPWAEMVSYCPQFPEGARLCVRRIPYDAAAIAAYDKAARAFLAEVDLEVMAIATMTSLHAVLSQAVA